MYYDRLNAQQGIASRFSAVRIFRWFVFVGVLTTFISGFEAIAQQSPNLLGASRGDVMRAFGEPENTLRKGDVDVLMYPDGVRIEIRDDVVIDYRGSVGSGILSRGGTEYAAGEDGNVHEAEQKEIEQTAPAPEAEVVPAESPMESAVVEPIVDEPEAIVEKSADEPLTGEIVAEENQQVVETEMNPDHLYDDAAAQAGKYLEGFGAVKEPEPPPKSATAVRTTIQVVARFCFALLILRITLGWLGRPFYFPDLVKVSLLYTAIRGGIHGIGSLGGQWQFINIFEVPDILAFLALAIMLFKFDVTKDGLTALKIAGATVAVLYFLMMGLGVVLVFGLNAIL